MLQALAAYAVGALVLGLTVLALAVLLRPADQANPPAVLLGPNSQAPEPVSDASQADVRGAHDALHDIGTQCAAGAGSRERLAIDRDVDVILAFTRRFPEGRFPIDDETGSPLSLLLVTREELRTCAPTAAGRVDDALPRELQDPAL